MGRAFGAFLYQDYDDFFDYTDFITFLLSWLLLGVNLSQYIRIAENKISIIKKIIIILVKTKAEGLLHYVKSIQPRLYRRRYGLVAQ